MTNRPPLQYNRQNPCPTDGKFVEYLKKYKMALSDALQIWKSEVVGQLVAMRGYEDLAEARMKLVERDGKYTPVISLIPFMGEEAVEELAFYPRMFRVYEELRDEIFALMLADIKATIDALAALAASTAPIAPATPQIAKNDNSNNVLGKKRLSRIKYLINIIKLMMAMHDADEFDIDLFESASEMQSNTLFASILRSKGFTHRVGDHFEQDGLLDVDASDVHIQGFREYVRKMYDAGIMKLPDPVEISDEFRVLGIDFGEDDWFDIQQPATVE